MKDREEKSRVCVFVWFDDLVHNLGIRHTDKEFKFLARCSCDHASISCSAVDAADIHT